MPVLTETEKAIASNQKLQSGVKGAVEGLSPQQAPKGNQIFSQPTTRQAGTAPQQQAPAMQIQPQKQPIDVKQREAAIQQPVSTGQFSFQEMQDMGTPRVAKELQPQEKKLRGDQKAFFEEQQQQQAQEIAQITQPSLIPQDQKATLKVQENTQKERANQITKTSIFNPRFELNQFDDDFYVGDPDDNTDNLSTINQNMLQEELFKLKDPQLQSDLLKMGITQAQYDSKIRTIEAQIKNEKSREDRIRQRTNERIAFTRQQRESGVDFLEQNKSLYLQEYKLVREEIRESGLSNQEDLGKQKERVEASSAMMRAMGLAPGGEIGQKRLLKQMEVYDKYFFDVDKDMRSDLRDIAKDKLNFMMDYNKNLFTITQDMQKEIFKAKSNEDKALSDIEESEGLLQNEIITLKEKAAITRRQEYQNAFANAEAREREERDKAFSLINERQKAMFDAKGVLYAPNPNTGVLEVLTDQDGKPMQNLETTQRKMKVLDEFTKMFTDIPKAGEGFQMWETAMDMRMTTMVEDGIITSEQAEKARDDMKKQEIAFNKKTQASYYYQGGYETSTGNPQVMGRMIGALDGTVPMPEKDDNGLVLASNCVGFARYCNTALPYNLFTWQDKREVVNTDVPQIGSVMMMKVPTAGGFTSEGHVAVVKSINDDGTITIAESNFSNGGRDPQPTERIVSANDANILGYYEDPEQQMADPNVQKSMIDNLAQGIVEGTLKPNQLKLTVGDDEGMIQAIMQRSVSLGRQQMNQQAQQERQEQIASGMTEEQINQENQKNAGNFDNVDNVDDWSGTQIAYHKYNDSGKLPDFIDKKNPVAVKNFRDGAEIFRKKKREEFKKYDPFNTVFLANMNTGAGFSDNDVFMKKNAMTNAMLEKNPIKVRAITREAIIGGGKEKQSYDNFDKIVREVDRIGLLMKKIDAKKIDTGLIAGKLETLNHQIGKTTDADLAELYAAFGTLKTEYLRATSGTAVSDQEFLRISTLMGGIDKDKELNEVLINNFKTKIINDRDAPLRRRLDADLGIMGEYDMLFGDGSIKYIKENYHVDLSEEQNQREIKSYRNRIAQAEREGEESIEDPNNPGEMIPIKDAKKIYFKTVDELGGTNTAMDAPDEPRESIANFFD